MKFLSIFALLGSIGAALGGGLSICEPFLSNFQEFNQVMLTFLTIIQQNAINASTTTPILAPSYATCLKCDANNSITLAAKAISRLSGVDPIVIINILNSTVTEPFVAPLDCIAADLIFLRDQISIIKSQVVPEVKAMRPTTQTPVTSCANALARLGSNVPKFMSTTGDKSKQISSETALFESVGMADLYQEYLNNICLWDIVAAGFGSLFDVDGSSVIPYIEGQSEELPFPFSCFTSFIDFLDSNLMKQVKGMFTGTLRSLTLPRMF